MKYFIAALALVAVASARSLDNHFLPLEGQFDIHPAVDVVSDSQVSQSAGSPLVQIILNIQSNNAEVVSPVAPVAQPIVEPIVSLPVTLPIDGEAFNPLPVILPIDVAPVNPIVLPIALPIIPEAGQIVDTVSVADLIVDGQIIDTVSIAEPIFPGQIVDTISIAEPIVPGEVVDTISIAEPIIPVPSEPIGIVGIPEILN